MANQAANPPSKQHGARIVDTKPPVMVRVTPDGVIQRTLRTVTLSAEKQHFYLGFVPGSDQKPKIITALGFSYLNSFSPLAWIPQNSIRNSDGREVGNPYRDLTTRTVSVRRFAVGRAMDGTLRAHDLTVIYDVNAYFAADVLGKYNYVPRNHKGALPTPAWGKILNDRAADKFLDKNDTWASVPIAPGVTLVFDATNETVRKLYREHAEREKFPDRFATTICERNIFKKHFGFSTVPSDGKVQIACWQQPEFDFESLQDRIITRNGKILIDGEEVMVEVAEETATAEDLNAVVNDENDGPVDHPHEETTTEEPCQVDNLRSNLRTEIKSMGGGKVAEKVLAEKLAEYKLRSLSDVATLDDEKKLSGLIDVCIRHSKEGK
jgi:hypothetical protein